jgi:PKD repeat protein
LPRKFSILLLIACCVLPLLSQAQCPRLNNGAGAPSANPYWVSCNGSNYTLFIQSPDTIGPYTLDFGDGTTPVSGAGLVPPNFITHTYAAAVDTFIVTLTSGACTVTGVVVLETTPSASIEIPSGNPLFGCTPATFSFRNGSTNVSQTTRFTWTFGDNSPPLLFDHTNLGQTLQHTYLPGSTTDCNIAVTLTAENYCNRGNPSINTYQPVQVWDRDMAQITANRNILCFPQRTFHFDNTSTLNCFAEGNNSQRYEYWNFGDHWGQGRDSIIPFQPFNPPNRPGYNITYPGPGTYTVLLIDSSFCGRDTALITVQVVLPPSAAFTVSRDTICQGESIDFSNQSTGAASFNWNFADGTAPVNTGSTAPLSHTFNNPGTFTVRLIAYSNGAGGCSDTVTRSIFVKASPAAVFVMDNPSGCDSLSVTFTDFSANAVSWSWDFGNGSVSNAAAPPTQRYPSPGVYTVSLTVGGANGCFGSTTDQVNVYRSPVGAIAPPPSVCAQTVAVFTDSSLSSPGDPVTTWAWDFGDGSPGSSQQNPTHTYNQPGTYTVSLSVATAHCPGTTGTRTITVNILPAAAFGLSSPAGCTPLTVQLTDSSGGASGRTWTFGDGSSPDTSLAPSHTFVNAHPYDTAYRVTLVVRNVFGCQDTALRDITVYRATAASFTSNAVPGCSPVPVSFSNTSAGASGYTWDFGDGTPSSNALSPSHQYVNNTPFIQYYQARLVAASSNGCTDTSTETITVYPRPSYNVQVLPPSQAGCALLEVQFQASSSGVNYSWHFGDGDSSRLQNPVHIFDNSGSTDSIYRVQLVAVNAFFCTDTSYRDITVYPLPDAAFTALPDSQVYPNATVSLSNTSTGASNYAWSFGDNSSSLAQSPGTHTYATWGDYYISLHVLSSNSCRDSAVKRVRIIAPKPVAAFSMSDTSGCMPLKVSFGSLPSPSLYARSCAWDFGDGGTSREDNPLYSYRVSGRYTVTLVVSGDGGRDTLQRTVEVFRKPEPFFTVNPTVVYVPSDPMHCLNLTTFGTSFRWDFGDGSTSSEKNPVHYYKSKGVYDIKLVATSDKGCVDSVLLPAIVRGEIRSDIVFPNAFSPSTLGSSGGYYDRNSFDNQVFFPQTDGVVEYQLMIFNRWGEMIFDTRDLNVGWDGYYKGQLCQQDVYVWKVVAKMSDGRVLNKAGDVTLLR